MVLVLIYCLYWASFVAVPHATFDSALMVSKLSSKLAADLNENGCHFRCTAFHSYNQTVAESDVSFSFFKVICVSSGSHSSEYTWARQVDAHCDVNILPSKI